MPDDFSYFEASVRSFNEQMARIDQLALITLKGHLLIEEKLVSIIEQHVFNSERLEAARLQFRQKVELCKGFGLRKDKLSIWSLVEAINALRNAFAHSLDSQRHATAMAKLRKLYEREIATCDASAEERVTINPSDDSECVRVACAMCFGFLATFEEDSRALREHIDALDRELNAEVCVAPASDSGGA